MINSQNSIKNNADIGFLKQALENREIILEDLSESQKDKIINAYLEERKMYKIQLNNIRKEILKIK